MTRSGPRPVRLLLAAALVGSAVTGVTPATASTPSAAVTSGTVTAGAAATADVSAATPFELTSERTGKPLRWLACRPIEYRINPSGEPAGMTAVVRRVMDTIGRQTGTRFRYAGHTSHRFASTGHADMPTVYLQFTAARHTAGQTFGWPGQVGVGGPSGAWIDSGGSRYEAIVYGRVLLSTRFEGPREGSGATWRALIMHEVGHALNLGHRASATEVMHAELTERTPDRFSPREVRALRRVLQTSGCDYRAWRRL